MDQNTSFAAFSSCSNKSGITRIYRPCISTVRTEPIAAIVVRRTYDIAFSFPDRAKIIDVGVEASHRHQAANAIAKSFMTMAFAITYGSTTASSNVRRQTLAMQRAVADRDSGDARYERQP